MIEADIIRAAILQLKQPSVDLNHTIPEIISLLKQHLSLTEAGLVLYNRQTLELAYAILRKQDDE
jgi:hypothetical protein